MSTSDYVMDRTPTETARLIAQSALYADATSHLLARAGIGPGMSVLDVGCGAGDVALAAARLIGESGRVVAVDTDPGVVAAAQKRAAATEASNIEFRCGTLPDLDLGEPFDAVVGRLVLLHVPAPAQFLSRLAGFARDGGIITFQELAIDEMAAVPATPLFTATLDRATRTLAGAGVDAGMARRLPRLFTDAGLATPRAAGYEPVATGEQPLSDAARYLAGSFTSMLATAERLGVATTREVDPTTLAERLHAELVELSATVFLPPIVAAWSLISRSADRRSPVLPVQN